MPAWLLRCSEISWNPARLVSKCSGLGIQSGVREGQRGGYKTWEVAVLHPPTLSELPQEAAIEASGSPMAPTQQPLAAQAASPLGLHRVLPSKPVAQQL